MKEEKLTLDIGDNKVSKREIDIFGFARKISKTSWMFLRVVSDTERWLVESRALPDWKKDDMIPPILASSKHAQQHEFPGKKYTNFTKQNQLHK